MFNGTHARSAGKQRIGSEEMHTQRKYRRGDLRPAMIAAIVAIGGIAAILFGDLEPSNASQNSGTARMITAAAVSRAGAIEIPSELPAAPPAS